ncbi:MULTISPECIES: hypothetical protein [unclassified Lactococcus]|nr:MULTISPECIES: hypothetical protein [unclassified Lactococcus]MQW23080.1 hypothetical protein [Lactococcus sp. dk101]TXK44425.1 hypothetical protein FVP42_05605 [Lactococcus sp. dk310]TXK50235.1 hypothetical protein FVP43_05575 [Lactococcus sp. dk322]
MHKISATSAGQMEIMDLLQTTAIQTFFNGGMIIMMIAIFALLIGAAYLIWKQTRSNTSGHQSVSALTEQELRDELEHRKSSKDLEQELADLKREIKALKEK